MKRLFVTLPLAAFAVACGHATPPPAQAPAAAPPARTSAANDGARHEGVNLSKEIRDMCGIAEVSQPSKFDFDSPSLSPTDRDALDQLARCLTTGPLKGRNVRLIGRADPRGETEYNMTLGESRATSVHKYLTSLGVDSKRVTETSRGELDATGHDEEGWRNDRRVDITLL